MSKSKKPSMAPALGNLDPPAEANGTAVLAPPAEAVWLPGTGERVRLKNGGGTVVVAPPQDGDDPKKIRVETEGSSPRFIKLANIEPMPPPDPVEEVGKAAASIAKDVINSTLKASGLGPLGEAPKPAEATAAGDPESPESFLAEMKRRAHDIAELEREADDDELAKKRATTKAKNSAEALLEAYREQNEFVEEFNKPVPAMPLLDAARQPKAAKPSANGIPKPAAVGDDAAGLAEPVVRLALSHALTKKLDEAGFKTVGDIARWTESGLKRLADITGFGKSSAEILEAALAGFWDARRAAAIPAPEKAAPVDPVASSDPETGKPASAPADAATGKPGPNTARYPKPAAQPAP